MIEFDAKSVVIWFTGSVIECAASVVFVEEYTLSFSNELEREHGPADPADQPATNADSGASGAPRDRTSST